MKHEIEEGNLKQIQGNIEALEKLLDERIVDLHQVKGGMESRHVFCYYRQLVWNIKLTLRDNVKPIKQK